jgi:hypothetical protein
MKYVLSTLLLFWICIADAQDSTLLDKFIAGVSKSCVVIDYTYTARISGVNNHGSGILTSQDQMWVMKGNGVEMYCDGATVWVVDPSAKEVVIEPVSDEQETAFLTNPARIVLSIGDSFILNAVNPSPDAKAQIYSLIPKSSSGIDYLNVELLEDSASLRNVTFALSDGNLVKIKVSSMKLTPEAAVEIFRPQTVFDSKWIVTDFR